MVTNRNAKHSIAPLAALLFIPLLMASGGRARADLSGPYHIANDATNKCLGVVGSSYAAGVLVEQETCTGDQNQSWWISTLDSYNWIINANSGLCLDIQGLSTDNGTPIDQWPCNQDVAGEQWWVQGNNWRDRQGRLVHVIQNAASRDCLDLENGYPDDGIPLQIWECNANTLNQYWLLIP